MVDETRTHTGQFTAFAAIFYGCLGGLVLWVLAIWALVWVLSVIR